MRRFCATMIVITFALLLAGGTLHAATYSEVAEFTFDPVPGFFLHIDGDNGPITFERWGGPHIAVAVTKSATAFTTAAARSAVEGIRVDSRVAGDLMQVTGRVSRTAWFVSTRMAFHILVPSDWLGKVLLETKNGAIEAVRIDGDIQLRTSNGAIRVRGHAGRLSAETSNGSIELTDVDSVVSARTSNGTITVRDAVLVGMGELATSNGRVTLEGALRNDADYSVRTANGSIDLTVANPNMRISLSVSNGSIKLTNVDVHGSHIGSRLVEGSIGLGTGKLVATTSNGSITMSAR